MKTKSYHHLLALLTAGLLGSLAHAGVPLNNLEGVGGVAFNPLAYTAGQNKDEGKAPWDLDIVSKPQLGTWYVSLPKTNVDWVAGGAAVTWFNRLETSIGREVIAKDTWRNIHKDNFGAKLLLVKENDFDTTWLPAISVGLVNKHLNYSAIGSKTSGTDYYLVATKLITAIPSAPVLVSGGLISTQGYATGALGFDAKRDDAWFLNTDVVLGPVAVGLEYREGAKFSTVKNASYYDAHLAWFVTKQLTLVAAYVNTGDEKSASKPDSCR